MRGAVQSQGVPVSAATRGVRVNRVMSTAPACWCVRKAVAGRQAENRYHRDPRKADLWGKKGGGGDGGGRESVARTEGSGGPGPWGVGRTGGMDVVKVLYCELGRTWVA